jgi:hypothetical protein
MLRIYVLCQTAFAPSMHVCLPLMLFDACMPLMLLAMMMLLTLFVAIYNLYELFRLAIYGTSSPARTTISEEENKLKEVDSDPIASSKPNRKYNSGNEMYHFLVRGPHLVSVPRHPLIDQARLEEKCLRSRAIALRGNPTRPGSSCGGVSRTKTGPSSSTSSAR